MHLIKNQESKAVPVFAAVAIRAVVSGDGDLLEFMVSAAQDADFEVESVGQHIVPLVEQIDRRHND